MNALYYGAPLLAHPIVLSFDDGYADNYTYALPSSSSSTSWRNSTPLG